MGDDDDDDDDGDDNGNNKSWLTNLMMRIDKEGLIETFIGLFASIHFQ